MTTQISICMGSACFARGNSENITIIENFIKENNLDAKIELVGFRCEGKCAEGPNIYIDNKAYHNVTQEKILEILKGLL